MSAQIFLNFFLAICILLNTPSIFVFADNNPDIIVDTPDDDVDDLIKKPNNPWVLQMVHNIRWDRSKAYMGLIKTKIMDEKEFHLGETPTSGFDARGLPYEKGLWEDGEMSYFVGMDQPNMHIEFNTTDDYSAYCHVGIIPDEVLDLVLKEYKNYGNSHCTYDRKIYELDDKNDDKVQKKKKYAFCSLDDLIREKLPSVKMPTWILANGTYHPPSETPDCIYDFYKIAKDTNEYNFFTYCAKAYYYNGRDYDNQDPRVKELRKDMVMHIFEGKVTCSLSSRIQENMNILKKGYRVELVQHYDFHNYRFYDEQYYCPQLRAKLAKYEDNRQDGRFFFAGMVGAAQLENYIIRSYWGYLHEETHKWHVQPKKFWDKETYTTLYKEMDLDLRACYLHYHNLVRRYRKEVSNYSDDGKRITTETPSPYYNIQLRVVHFCNERGLRESLAFDIKMRADQAPTGIFEDNDLIIDLTEKRLIRPTGQTFCAYGQPDCGKMQKTELHPEPRANKRREAELAIDSQCETANQYARSRDCPMGNICNDKELRCKFGPKEIREKDSICNMEKVEQGALDSIISIVDRQITFVDRSFKCMKNLLQTNGQDCQGLDLRCRENEFCARTEIEFDKETKSECRQLRARELGETCYLTDECVPGTICHRTEDSSTWGECVSATYYQCPNRSYRTPCYVKHCTRGMKTSAACQPTFGPESIICPKRTAQGYEWNAWTCGAEDLEEDDGWFLKTLKSLWGNVKKFISSCSCIGRFLPECVFRRLSKPLACIESFTEAAYHYCCL